MLNIKRQFALPVILFGLFAVCSPAMGEDSNGEPAFWTTNAELAARGPVITAAMFSTQSPDKAESAPLPSPLLMGMTTLGLLALGRYAFSKRCYIFQHAGTSR